MILNQLRIRGKLGQLFKGVVDHSALYDMDKIGIKQYEQEVSDIKEMRDTNVEWGIWIGWGI